MKNILILISLTFLFCYSQSLSQTDFYVKIKEPGLYCAQCDKCKTQCWNHLDIPSYMRSYMYAYAYRKPSEAKRVITQISPGDVPCVSYNDCRINCTMGFNVREKIIDVSRLKSVSDEFLV